ncbi:MAG TPA: PKD domain-containing protein [Bacteroidia bacterium]|nr:PKD domain-containing protein [Bacteroidia bacterium]
MNKKLLKKISVSLLVILMTCFIQKTYASHSMGADLTYECLGGNTYKVRLSFYRDCIGIAAPTNAYVNISSASCGQTLGVTCYPIPGTGQEVTPICPSATSTCNGGNFTGIQEWVYEGIVTLPMQCTDWMFSYNLCCRNAAITTITTPGVSTFYIYATLNNVISPCNNSPTFSNKPVPFICQGQEFCFNHGAFDSDGDSLVYSLITPLQTAGSTVNYINPYSATNPLNSIPAMQFNTQTGDICMTPQQLQVTVMAVLVEEYRNGVLIGSVERDIQITVITCTNTLPTLTGINGTNNFTATICANQQFCFDIFSNDPDAGQNVFVSWDNGIPAGTFSTNTAQHPTGIFCWTPTTADIGGTYCFTAKVHDDACPYMGSQIYSYCLTVIGVTADAGPDQFIACNDFATIYANGSGGNPPYTYLWSTGATQQGITVPSGTYVVTVSDGTCSGTDTVEIVDAYIPIAAFTANPGCFNMPVQFIDQSTTPGGTINSWSWNFGDGTTSNIQNPIHLYIAPGTYNVTLIIANSFGCIDTVTLPITILPIPIADFTFPTICAGTAVPFTNTTTPAGSLYTWNWNLGNGQTSNGQNATGVYPNAGTYTVTLIAGDSLGCADTITQQVTVNPSPVAGFTFTGGSTCQNGSVTLTNTSTGGVSYYWNLGNGQTSTLQDPTVTYNQPGNYDITLVVTSANGCVDSLTQTVTIFPLPTANAGPDQHVCLGGNVTLIGSGGVIYQWSNGATTDITTVSPSNTTTYTVTVTDANGCTAIDQVTVIVDPLPIATISPDQSICLGQSVTLTAGGGNTYSWNPTGSTTSTITVTPSNSTTYAVNVTDGNGCTGTAFVNVTVHPLPSVNLQNGFVCTGQTTILDAGNPGSTYYWTPNGQTTQTITVSSAGTYGVIVTNAFGCTDTDSSIISLGGTITNNLSNVAFCQGGSAVLDAGNPGNTYLWTPGGQTTQTITVNSSGSYSVVITDPNGCSGTISTTVNVNPLPQANFTPNDVCINDPMNFFDISVVNGGTITSWQWDFGDGNVSQQQNPVHVYANPGNYTVTFTVTSNSGCTSTIVKSFNVFPLPSANFNFNNNCAGNNIAFTNASTTSVGNIVSWNWNFGDGSTSTLQNPLHQFAAAGTYPVTLLVTTGGGCEDSIVKQVTVFPLPVADFTATTACLHDLTVFTNNSTVPNGVMSGWLWNFGDATTAGVQNPVHTYSTSGTFNVSLIVTSTDGCSDTIQKPVIVNPLPNANAGTDQSICSGGSATLTATGGTSYLWNPGGATTASITVNPLINSFYGVVVTDANGCSDTDSVLVIIKALPVASAGPDKAVCAGLSATLTATGGVSYLWNPGGATTASITVNPSSTTSYIVTVTGANGCTSTDTANVTINQMPVISAGPDATICNGSTTGLTASGGISYIWSPSGDTSATIYVNPAANTTYTVLVTDTNGCKNSDTIDVFVNPTPVVNLSPTFICAGNSTTLNAGNTGSTFLWTPNGETTQSITVSDSGNYGVIVTNSFGCQGSGSSIVTVGGTGIMGNLGNVAFCAGGNDTLNAGNAGSTYIWSNGATSQSIVVNAAGTYTVTITDPTGCTNSFYSNVSVNPLPVPDFTTSPTCLSSMIPFNNTSTIPSGNIISWSWDFGDGTNSTLQNPTHQYATSGIHVVTLQATSGNGCTASVTQNVGVGAEPTANFSGNASCFGTAAVFTDLSTITNGVISSWDWNFGDGSSSTQQNPSHLYNAPGTYNVTVTVASGGGCTASFTASVTINPKPVADFSTTSVCKNATTDFTDLSTMQNGSINSYAWSFGDGGTSNLQNPSHTYANDGSYTATLIVTSDLGCTDTISQTVKVNPLPLVSFTAPAVCFGNATIYSDGSSVTSGSINGWYWEFGDGTSSNQQNPSHIFNNDGTYNVMLVVTTDNGCSDSSTQSVIVNPLPGGGFVSQNVCLNNATQFTDTSTVSSGSITNWLWDLGDGNNSSVQNPSHIYSTPGTYNVSLVVSTANGCKDTIIQSVNVFPLPVAQFSSASVCFGFGTAFYNQSTVNGGGNVTCSWNFGDGSTDTTLNPVHAFAAWGTYNVTMTATTGQGCIGTITQPVSVFELPYAHFNGSDVCLNVPTVFNDQSGAPAGGSLVSWNWDFGDNGLSSSQNPIHIYGVPGTYNVQLIVTSDLGCSDLFSDSVRVFVNPVPVIAVNAGCITDPVTFINIEDSTNVSGSTLLWSFGDGNTSTDVTPTHIYAAAGTYTITFEETNANGCKAIVTTTVEVNPAPDAGFTAENGCANEGIQFTNTSTIASGTITGYIWIFGDSSAVSAEENPVHTYQQSGTYTITMIATSNLGCTDTVTMQIVINPEPATAFLSNIAAGCGPLPVQFTDASYIQSGNIISWSWNFGDGSTSNDQNPVHIYTQSGAYPVSLTVTSDSGCTKTVTISNMITVYPAPEAEFIPEPANANILYPVINFNNLSTGSVSQLWTFGDGSSSTDEEPSHTYADTGTYLVTLYVENSFGCWDTVSHLVHIDPITTFYIPNAFSPNSDGNNEVFTVKGINILAVKLDIYNRWGDRVFASENGFTHPWDGSVIGSSETAVEDVYIYVADIKDVFGKWHHRKGRVTLVR